MRNTGYQQAIYAKKVSHPGNFPLDVDGNLCSESHKKQAVLLLEGEENRRPDLYEVEGTFNYGDVIDGYDTRIYNPDACPLPLYDDVFEANKSSMYYPVSRDGLGFDIKDTVLVESCYEDAYADYVVTSAPSWLTASKGTVSGKKSTLNLTVSRNRDSDDEKSGIIVLTQNNTGKIIHINVRQAGRLTDGIPTEYPYVTTENLIDRYYQTYSDTDHSQDTWRDVERPHRVVQVGRQRWLGQDARLSYEYQSGDLDVTQSFQMKEGQYNTWLNAFPYAREWDWQKFNTEMAGSNYRGQFAQRIIEQGLFNQWQKGYPEGYNHRTILYDDFKELMGFVVAYFWDGTSGLYDANYIRSITKGKTLMKLQRDLTNNGYDADRKVYIDGIDPDLVHHGEDTFGLGFHSNYIFNDIDPFNNGEHLSRVMIAITYMIGDFIDSGGGIGSVANRSFHRTMEYGKSIPSPWDVPDPANKGAGWAAGNEKSNDGKGNGFVGKAFRSIRNVELPFNIYTNGAEIIRVNKGGSVPSGYVEVPTGALAGAYFARPDFTYAQWDAVNGFVNWQIGPLDQNPETKVQMIG